MRWLICTLFHRAHYIRRHRVTHTSYGTWSLCPKCNRRWGHKA